MKKIVLFFLTLSFVILFDVFGFAFSKGLIVNGRTMIPVRGVFEELGFKVDWYDEEQAAVITDDKYVIIIPKGEDSFSVYETDSENNIDESSKRDITPDVPQQIIEGSFHIPLRAVCEAVGADLEWDNDTKTAFIFYGDMITVAFCGEVPSDYSNEDDIYYPTGVYGNGNYIFTVGVDTVYPDEDIVGSIYVNNDYSNPCNMYYLELNTYKISGGRLDGSVVTFGENKISIKGKAVNGTFPLILGEEIYD